MILVSWLGDFFNEQIRAGFISPYDRTKKIADIGYWLFVTCRDAYSQYVCVSFGCSLAEGLRVGVNHGYFVASLI